MSPRKASAAFALCWLIGLWAQLASAHPFHSSLAQIDWAADGNALEISLRVTPEELESAVSRGGTQLVLEHEPQQSPRLQQYLAQTFVIADEGGASHPLTLVGFEVNHAECWLYFTVAADREQALSLNFTVLFDLNPSQSNRLQRLWLNEAQTLLFNAEQPRRAIWP